MIKLSQKLFQAAEYLEYWLAQVDEHSLHPPFIYQFYTEIIKPAKLEKDPLAKLRKQLLKDQTLINSQPIGAASTTGRRDRTVADIASNSITKPKYAALLTRLAGASKANTIIELGTSLGLQTLYFAEACPQAKIITFEGNKALVNYASTLFNSKENKNIQIEEGDIDLTLPEQINKVPVLDFVFIDANHKKVPTLSYFYTLLKKCGSGSMIVLDDIHWSSEMKKAWQEIIAHPDTTVTIDLYQLGIVLIKPELPKQHWVLTF